MNLLAVIGFTMAIILVYCLVTKKLLPPVAFITLPIAAALICGFGIPEISKFAADGIKKMVSTVSLFVFSIAYFSLMNEAGLFDGLVDKLTGMAGRSITGIMLATAAIAIVGHLDGSAVTTFIITIAAMGPIYKKMNIRRANIMLICTIGVGVMNIVPWGGPTLRAATVLGMDAADLWRPLIPAQIVAVAFTFGAAYLISKYELATNKDLRLAGSVSDGALPHQEPEAPKRLIDPNNTFLMWFNYLVTIGVLAALMFSKLNSAFVFMVGLALVLTANIRDLKTQSTKLKEYGTSAMTMVVTLFTAGVFVGVMNGTGMINEMAKTIVSVIPISLGAHIHIIMGILAVPMIMCLGTDAFYYGMMPVVIGVAQNFGVAGISVAHTFIIAENIGVCISPLTPAIYVGLGMLDMDVGEHIKYSFPWVWGGSIVMMMTAVALGIIPF